MTAILAAPEMDNAGGLSDDYTAYAQAAAGLLEAVDTVMVEKGMLGRSH
jgi:hypothetical protein